MPLRESAHRLPHIAAPLSGFDFTSRIRAVCEDVVARVLQLQHIDMGRVAVSFSQARRRVPYGLYATLTPMRFKDGARTETRRGRRYTTQQLLDKRGREFLYILSFYLPRFMDVPLREKLITIFHELWHISPYFNGDIRRYSGRCFAHSHSQKEYDQRMSALVDEWLERSPPQRLYEFLRLNFDHLHRRHGRVVGVKIPRPKLVPIE